MGMTSILRCILAWGLIASANAAPPSLQLDAADTARMLASPTAVAGALAATNAPGWAITAMDAYAEDAQVVQLDGSYRRELARSTHRLFRLSDTDGNWLGLLVLDANGAFVDATVFGGVAIYRGEPVDGNADLTVEFRDLAEFLPEGTELSSSCGLEQSRSPAILPSLAPSGTSARATNAAPAGALVHARLAIDSDNEFMSEKFSNNVANANNYVVALVGLMSVIYERDLGVRLTIGTMILRTTADPYSTSGASTPAQLNEFGEFWRVNQGAVPRAFALQLSGKSSNANSSSGIAWLLTSGNYCAATGQLFGGDTFGHFSVNQVFTFSQTASFDVSLVAHELGHNFGANHTHCTDTIPGGSLQPIDMCFGTEMGCYSGAVSCPVETSGQGTLMSYCHFNAQSGGPNCGAVRQEFHPFHITQLSGRVLTNTQNGCFTPAAAGNGIFGNGFE